MKPILLALFMFLSSVAIWAQGTSQIQGVVKDSTGAVIGGAEVKATQTDTGVSRTVISSEDGVYFLRKGSASLWFSLAQYLFSALGG